MQSNGNIAIRGAHIITMTPGQLFADSLVVKAGEIAAIGSCDHVAPACEGLQPLDLEGNSVLPGMIDTHTHFLWTALHAAAVDLEAVHDHQELKKIIDAAVREISPGEHVLGMGHTEDPLEAERMGPIVAALDSVAPRIAFQEGDRGSLVDGKLGDFVVLREDPYQINPRGLKDIPIEMTVLGGEVMYSRG